MPTTGRTVTESEKTIKERIAALDASQVKMHKNAPETAAEIARAAAALDFARADLTRAEGNLKFAASERARVDRLRATRTVSARALEAA